MSNEIENEKNENQEVENTADEQVENADEQQQAEEAAEEKTKAPVSTKKLTSLEILEHIENGSKKEKLPYFEIGDTVDVHCKIVEGEKTRIQIFTGTVIARRGSGMNEMFTVRRMVGEEGVERTFPIHSPNVQDVRPIRSGKTRRAKLYYLRNRTGKGVRLSRRHSDHTVRK